MKALGVDLGGKSIKLGLTEEGRLLRSARVPVAAGAEYRVILGNMVEAARSLLAGNGDVKSCGIGSPGIVDSASGTVLYANQFEWSNAALRDDVKEALGIEVRIGNDARFAALGEAVFGAGRGYVNVVFLGLGTGVGGGLNAPAKKIEKTGEHSPRQNCTM